MEINRINNVFTDGDIGNINFSSSTISSTTGDLILLIDTDDIQFNNGTDVTMNVTSTGIQTLPLQSCFLAYLSANVDNSTGAGAEVTINFDTEVKDLNGDFSSGTTFTAPIFGKYLFCSNVTFSGLSVAMTSARLKIVTSNIEYQNVNNAQAMSSTGDNGSIFLSVITTMDAADTAQVLFQVSGGAGSTADIIGSSTLQTFFCGGLLA